MNVSGIVGSLKSNADNLGYLAGILSNDNINSVISSVQQLTAGVVHAPDLTAIQTWAMNEGKNALLAYIAGVALEGFNLPVVGSLGQPLKKAAQAYAISTGAVKVLYGMTHSEIKGTNIENSPSVRANFANAPALASYNY